MRFTRHTGMRTSGTDTCFPMRRKQKKRKIPLPDGTEAVGRCRNMLSAASLARLQDYDYLMKQYFSVHASTTAERSLMKAERLLETDVGLTKNPDEPQILIYHTHASETYADYGPQNTDADVVGAGTYLTELLRQRGWNVIHDTTAYDRKKESWNAAVPILMPWKACRGFYRHIRRSRLCWICTGTVWQIRCG